MRHSKRTDRINETNIMHNGLEATIISYENTNNITVRFSNGYEVKTTYRYFKEGRVKGKTNNTKRLGETRIMNNGKEATIIAYRNSKDIDVQFNNGRIIKHCIYVDFRDGKIKNFSFDTKVGEKNIMNCGEEAVIIEYRNYNDIDIQFADGTIRTKRNYQAFKNGKIAKNEKEKIKIGDKKLMNCGKEAIVIAYRKYNDIDILFENGKIRRGVSCHNFIKGQIKDVPMKKRKSRIYESRIMNNGKKATIIAYRNSHDIDVQFEDGFISRNKSYSKFCKGKIGNRNLDIRVGEKILCAMEKKLQL